MIAAERVFRSYQSEAEWLAMRRRVITSTDIAGLFQFSDGSSMSPYTTALRLYHEKRGTLESTFKENERTRAGRAMEDAIAALAAQERGWQTQPAKLFGEIPDLRIGSSFDHAVIGLAARRVLECKNVDTAVFYENWIERDADIGIEAPWHIELQVQHQLLVADAQHATIAALVGGNRLILIDREAHPDVQAAIVARCADFWRRVEANEPPEPSAISDVETLRAIYNYAQPGKILDATLRADVIDLVSRYHEAMKAEKNAQEEKRAIGSMLLAAIADAERVIVPGFTVSAGTVHREAHTVNASNYRALRITRSKTK